jgi:hypothetical protein
LFFRKSAFMTASTGLGHPVRAMRRLAGAGAVLNNDTL